MSAGKLPAEKGVKEVCQAAIDRTFEFVLVRCDMVTLSLTKPDYYYHYYNLCNLQNIYYITFLIMKFI